MSALPRHVAERYSAIIDSILGNADLNTISAKAIRKGLQEQLDHDISGQKEIVTKLIMERFDKFNDEQNGVPDPPTNGHAGAGKRTADQDSAPSELDDSPPSKKAKKHRRTEDDDAAYAAKLQAEENRAGRARSTRGGNTKKKAPPQKKKAKKKSANRVKDEDDSDLGSGSGGEKKSPKRTGGFHKPMNLSAPLQQLLGETQLSRPQTVKKIWEYVKARDLQDPADKRQIRCDDAMRAVFKQDSVHMFTMNKILNTNLYPVEED